MQSADSIIRQPILLGLLLSIAVHAAVLHNRGIYAPSIPHMDAGRTVVQLTLLPSRANPSSAPGALSAPSPANDVLQPETLPMVDDKVIETAATESIEQDATLENSKGVITEAVASSSFYPSYPRISKNRGEEGAVLLEVQVLADGTVGAVAILQSSGYRRLDKAAVQGARQTTFTPAIRLGKPVASTTELSFTFRLTDD